MKARILHFCLIALFVTGCATHRPPTEVTVTATTTLADVEASAGRWAGEYGEEDVLVLFDLDNTLLIGTSDLGSDAWYYWQSALGKESPCDPAVVSDRFALQGALFHLGAMEPTEAGIPDRLERLRTAGHPVMLLTARGKDYRLPTFRELRRNDLSFARSMPYVPGTELTFDFAERPVLFEDGAMLVAGQHKGDMLIALFDHYGWERPDAVVFADDKQKNVDAVVEALRREGIAGTAFRYDGVVDRVNAFEPAANTRELTALFPSLKNINDIMGTANFKVPETLTPEECQQ